MTSPLPDRAPGPDPIAVFQRWRAEVEGQMPEPDAITVATATAGGVPSARMVLMRRLGSEGVTFYTNYESRKGRELGENPRAAVVWWAWPLRRQVRVEGSVTLDTSEGSDAYFAARHRGHQLGAHASAQSSVVRDRAELERSYAQAEARFEGAEVPRPEHWGGYTVSPEVVELWIQRDDRMHDRFSYTATADGWSVVRLAP
jgi:pyridoxamine 5'-phosphate oxidase